MKKEKEKATNKKQLMLNQLMLNQLLMLKKPTVWFEEANDWEKLKEIG